MVRVRDVARDGHGTDGMDRGVLGEMSSSIAEYVHFFMGTLKGNIVAIPVVVRFFYCVYIVQMFYFMLGDNKLNKTTWI